jgi:hypothetical protein
MTAKPEVKSQLLKSQLLKPGVGVEKVTDCAALLRRDAGSGGFFSGF